MTYRYTADDAQEDQCEQIAKAVMLFNTVVFRHYISKDRLSFTFHKVCRTDMTTSWYHLSISHANNSVHHNDSNIIAILLPPKYM